MIGTAWMAVITLLFGYTQAGALLVSVAFALLLLFRRFQRPLNMQQDGLLAPVDGQVKSIDEDIDPFTEQAAWRIVLQQRRLGEYHLYTPAAGTVTRRVAPAVGASINPVLQGHWSLALETESGAGLTLAYALRGWPRFLRVNNVAGGTRLARGQRLGLVGFGQTLTLWLPRQATLDLQPGQRLRAGVDIIGHLPDSAQP